MKYFIASIMARWRELDWMPPLPNLDRHLEHIAGGALVVLFWLSLGAPWLIAAITSTLVFTAIEGATVASRRNWSDSLYDWLQYQFHWFLFFLHAGLIVWAFVFLALWSGAYVHMLLRRW